MSKSETLPESPLSDRERDVLLAASQGFSVRATATLLNIGVATVKTHRANISRKLRVDTLEDSITASVAFALRKGYIS